MFLALGRFSIRPSLRFITPTARCRKVLAVPRQLPSFARMSSAQYSASQSKSKDHQSSNTASMKTASPDIMTLETDKETGVQYYKVNPNDIPEDWTNEPLVFDEFPFTCDEAGNKYPTSTGIPILALRDDGLFLFRDGDQYFFWWVIAGLLQRIDAPNDIAEILKAIREEKKLSVKIVNPNIMTLERDKETGVQYYKVDANYIPADWSNDPEEFEGFPYTNDLAGYKFPSDKGIPILAMHDDVRFLFQNGDRFYIWRAIAEHLDRIEAPNNIMAILETMKEGKRCQVTRLS